MQAYFEPKQTFSTSMSQPVFEILIAYKKKHVIETIILNLIEKTPLKYKLLKLASCRVPKHIVENRELILDSWEMHPFLTRKLLSRLLIMQSFS